MARALLYIACALSCLMPMAGAAALTANELAIVVNEADPLSVAIGEYYSQGVFIGEPLARPFGSRAAATQAAIW